jgi:hypothetical protein
MKEIKLTEFALRHFDPKFGGTKILDMSPENFEEMIRVGFSNFDDRIKELKEKGEEERERGKKEEGFLRFPGGILYDGYAPFCKLLAVKNFTDARLGSMPITLENYQYLRSGYSARREGELPVFSRWFDLPLSAPKAEFLMLVLYSKLQIDKEGRITEGEHGDPNEKYVPFDADWGIVAILGQSHNREEPMKPETMLRNALGVEEGGSGVALDKDKYLDSVEFWSKNATIK